MAIPSHLLFTMLPKLPAPKPKITNTTESPTTNKKVLTTGFVYILNPNILTFLFPTSSDNSPTYTGITGSMHGEKKEINPAINTEKIKKLLVSNAILPPNHYCVYL